jgi:hypothetical protein
MHKLKRDQAGHKVYYGPDGVIGPKLNGKTVEGVRVEYVSEGETIDIRLADFNDDIVNGAALYGISYMISSDYDEALARFERLQEGHWATEQGRSGPRTGNIVEAVRRAKEKAGQHFDAESFKERLVAMEDSERSTFVNQVLAMPEVQTQFNAIEREQLEARQSKRAALEGGGPLPS